MATKGIHELFIPLVAQLASDLSPLRVGGPSTVQAALAALVRDDLITRDADRYAVVDSLLREWIARQTF